MEEIKEVVEEVAAVEEKDGVLDTNLFNKLYNLPVDMYTEVLENKKSKIKLTYLSWANAYQLLMHQDPDATIEICEAEDGFPMFSRGNHHFVKTKVTAFGKTKTCFLPVMDSNHRAVQNTPYQLQFKTGTVTVPAIDARHINDSIMRCLVKNIAMFGIGLKLYTGEDLKQYSEVQSVNEPTVSKEQLDVIDRLSRETNTPIKTINDYCLNKFNCPLDKMYNSQANEVIGFLEQKAAK